MLIIPAGLNKGVLHFSGIGPDHVWTLIDRSGEMIDLWKIFAETLPNMEYAHLYVGREHFIFRGSARHETPELLNIKAINHYLKTGEVTQKKLRDLLLWITTISKSLHGKYVRLHVYRHEFHMLSKDYHEELKQRKIANIKGLYINKETLCHITHRKNICRIKKPGQCIFATIVEEIDHDNSPRLRYYCTYFHEKHRQKRLDLKERGVIKGAIHECSDIRGFEVF